MHNSKCEIYTNEENMNMNFPFNISKLTRTIGMKSSSGTYISIRFRIKSARITFVLVSPNAGFVYDSAGIVKGFIYDCGEGVLETCACMFHGGHNMNVRSWFLHGGEAFELNPQIEMWCNSKVRSNRSIQRFARRRKKRARSSSTLC